MNELETIRDLEPSGAAISPEFERDSNGNPLGTENLNDHPMAATLPLIGTSLTELIAADKILAIVFPIAAFVAAGGWK